MRIVGHIDLDAFFASVEERNKPRLRGRPIVVGADPEDGHGRGVVSTANYKAREIGIRSAIPISKAWELAEAARRKGFPEVVFISGNFRDYAAVSREVFAILKRFASQIEQTSVDEAYFDLSHTGGFGRAITIAENIRTAIKREQKITASIGIGSNKLIAKIAAGFKKPDGLAIVFPEDTLAFLAPLPAKVLPGVGPKTETILANEGLKTVADIQKSSRATLMDRLGTWGAFIYERAYGRDDSPIEEPAEAKSIGEQETFRHDTNDSRKLTALIKNLSTGVYTEFLRNSFKTFGVVVITVRFSDFKTVTRRTTLPAPGRTTQEIEGEALRLFLPFLDARENPQKKLIRLLGVRIERLSKVEPQTLF